jgi:toxin ParE1/3/4
MTKPVKRSGRSFFDTDEQADYIAQDNMDAADRYLDAVELAVLSLGNKPNRGTLYRTQNPKLKGLHRLAVPGFKNYLIFYYDRPTHVEVVRILHGARDLPTVLDGE